MELFIVAALMFTGGVLTGLLIPRFFPNGILRIDSSDPEKSVYRFEVDDMENLSKHKHIVLKVDRRANLSQN